MWEKCRLVWSVLLVCLRTKIAFLLRSQDASSNVIFNWSSAFFWKANITAAVIALLTEKLADDRQIHIAANICIWERSNFDMLPLVIQSDLIPFWAHVSSFSYCSLNSTFVNPVFLPPSSVEVGTIRRFVVIVYQWHHLLHFKYVFKPFYSRKYFSILFFS